MQSKKSIAAFFMLGVFLSMLFHNSIPHIHHVHSGAHATDHHMHHEHDYHGHHHHSHGHEHDAEHQVSSNPLLQFFNQHTHITHLHEQDMYLNGKVKPTVKKLDFLICYLWIDSLLSEHEENSSGECYDDWNRLYQTPFVDSQPLRGPPHLA